MNGGYWTGDEWRWRVGQHPSPSIQSMYVIEPAEKKERKGKQVPFGFGPRDEPETSEQPPGIDWLDVAEWAEGT